MPSWVSRTGTTRVESMSLRLPESMHDRATLVLSSSVLTSTDGMKGKPLLIGFGKGSAVETSLRLHLPADKATSASADRFGFELEVFGATFPMSTSFGPDMWRNRTTSSVIDGLAAKSNLGFFSESDDFAWPRIAQAEGSDWSLVLSQAAKTGLAVFNYRGSSSVRTQSGCSPLSGRTPHWSAGTVIPRYQIRSLWKTSRPSRRA